jgi:putative CocE/NonD family hydrolase
LQASGLATGIEAIQLRWSDHWLKGIDNGIMSEPPIRIFVMGANTWRYENEWPLARTKWTNYYLHSGGKANTAWGDGTLSTTPPLSEPAGVFLNNPRNPVPTAGGTMIGLGAVVGPRDQHRVENRPDVLTYSTSTLEEDVEITGPISATLFAATSARDTDCMMKLVDVHPDGRAFNVIEGVISERFRTGIEGLLEPESPYEYKLDLQATSIVFKRGHKIRIEISSTEPHRSRPADRPARDGLQLAYPRQVVDGFCTVPQTRGLGLMNVRRAPSAV